MTYFSFDFQINFDLYYYDIYCEGSKIRKYYHEKILDDETLNLVNSKIKELMFMIKIEKTPSQKGRGL